MAGAGLLAAVAMGSVWLGLQPPAVAVPPQGLVVSSVTVVNPGLDRRTRQAVTVRGGRIERVEDSRAATATGPFAGAFVLPGLIDMHVHHPPPFAVGERELFALLFLAHGVTSVRDAGSFGGTLLEHRRRIETGEIAGPRIFACGPVLDGDPPGWPGALVLENADDARSAVRRLAEADVDCIKVYNGVGPQIFTAVREAAAAHGLSVVAHVPWAVPFDAIRDAEVQHLMGLAAARWDVSPSRIDWYVNASRDHGITHTPTLVVFARGAELADYQTLRADPIARLLPPYYRELLWNPHRNPLVLDLSPGSFGALDQRLATMKAAVERLRAAGVAVLAGSDTMNPFVVPGASLHEELGHLVEAGLSPAEAWEAASRVAGATLGIDGLGILREGAPADFLVFREDPTHDLAALSTLAAVVAQGRLYPVSRLEEALARHRDHFEGVLPRAVSGGAARLVLAWARRGDGSEK